MCWHLILLPPVSQKAGIPNTSYLSKPDNTDFLVQETLALQELGEEPPVGAAAAVVAPAGAAVDGGAPAGAAVDGGAPAGAADDGDAPAGAAADGDAPAGAAADGDAPPTPCDVPAADGVVASESMHLPTPVSPAAKQYLELASPSFM